MGPRRMASDCVLPLDGKMGLETGEQENQEGRKMTTQQAKKTVGQLVSWTGLDARIRQPILERVGSHGIGIISFSVEHRTERAVTYKHVSELWSC